MKTTIKTLKRACFFLAILGMYSCDEVAELTEFDFDTSITEEFTVPLTDDNTELNGSFLVNLEDNEDVSEYLGNIEAIEITDASYTIINYVGAEEATGSISATAASQTFGPYNHTFFTDVQNATVFEFEDTSKLNTVANSLLNNNQVEVQFSGTQDPAQNGSLTIRVTFQLNVTAQVLP